MQRAIFPALARGELLLALAHGEPRSRYDIADVATRAERRPGGWALTGEKAVVLHGDSADRFIVSARVSGLGSDMILPLYTLGRGVPATESGPLSTRWGA